MRKFLCKVFEVHRCYNCDLQLQFQLGRRQRSICTICTWYCILHMLIYTGHICLFYFIYAWYIISYRIYVIYTPYCTPYVRHLLLKISHIFIKCRYHISWQYITVCWWLILVTAITKMYRFLGLLKNKNRLQILLRDKSLLFFQHTRIITFSTSCL